MPICKLLFANDVQEGVIVWKQKKFLCILAVSALALLGPQIAMASAGEASENELSLGKEISVVATDLLTKNSEIAKDFIFEVKVARANTQEEKLAIIQAKQEELASGTRALRDERRELIGLHNQGLIDNETFVTEIRKLAGKMQAYDGTIGSIGKKISQLNKQMSNSLSELAKARVEAHKELIAEFRTEHNATMEQLERMGYKGQGKNTSSAEASQGRGQGNQTKPTDTGKEQSQGRGQGNGR